MGTRWSLLVACVAMVGCDRVFQLDRLPDARVRPTDDIAVASDAYDPGIPDLVAWYPLDVVEAGTVRDLASGLDGGCVSARCPVATTGQIGGALVFDGVDDIIQVEPDAKLDTTSGFTIAFWSRLDATIAAPNIVCPVSKQHDMALYNNTYQLCFESVNMRFITWNAAAQIAHSIDVPVPSVGAWHHIAIRYDGTNKTLVIDGVAGTPEAATVSFDTGSGFTIGADIDDRVVALWPGAIDDVRIYDRPLTISELGRLASP